jgi:hypothetical protein
VIVGRNLYARVPSWLARYGPYPALDARGRPNLLLIKWAMPGRREAGRWWEITYDRFLLEFGFRRCSYCLRTFYLSRNGALLLLIIHVDDTRILYTERWLFDEFLAAWTLRFDEDPDVAEQSDSFTGLTNRRVGPGRIEVT